ncbi:MAG: hypothetical protein N5P05_002568 [Chroococcopsis gigantea SAG 12.99]|jgi:pSer/pThr/pTyr-binding forkhead associated (FHA) protein|nr:FHA domain-containing protein [Chlorogloea purpurea SAG 13.99]MDV3000962.1 hypothetical protein [Chroococcopsis gigantea SAG 12.99]
MTNITELIQKQHFLIIEDEKGRRKLVLRDVYYSLGRSPGCKIHLQSRFVSRYHATLERCLDHSGSSYYRLIDGDGKERISANGLLVNGKKIEAHKLRHGDEIVFGPQVFAIYQYIEIDGKITYSDGNVLDVTLLDPSIMEFGDEDEDTTGLF